MERVSRGFREGLRRELPAWRAEGLVTDEAARALAGRYELAAAETGGPSFLAVYVLGALLVGAGVVSLVAWHWDAMGAAAKLATLGVAMVAAHGAGFALWKGSGRARAARARAHGARHARVRREHRARRANLPRVRRLVGRVRRVHRSARSPPRSSTTACPTSSSPRSPGCGSSAPGSRAITRSPASRSATAVRRRSRRSRGGGGRARSSRWAPSASRSPSRARSTRSTRTRACSP